MIESEVIALYDHYVQEMGRAGHRIQKPANSDFTKTYQYRYAVTFSKRLDEMKLDVTVGKQLITEIIKYDKRKPSLAAWRCITEIKKTLFEVCIGRIESNLNSCDDELNSHEIVRFNES